MNPPPPARIVAISVLCLALLGAAACREEGGVKVASMKFNGLRAVEAGQLTSVLATGAGSKLPWGEKRYFNREQFEADLKRIVAFYRDRGYPEARVTSFDVVLSDDQSSVDITLNIDEGAPIVAERIELVGFDMLQPRRRAFLERRLPLQPGQPLDRALAQASRESALDLLKDTGYPFATVTISDAAGSTDRSRVLTLAAEPGPLARFGPIEITGNSSVSDDVIARQLTFKPGDRFRQSRLIDSQRKLYGLEVFQFANVQTSNEEGTTPAEIPMRITVTEGKHRKVNFSVGYGTEEKGRVEVDWRHVNFFGGARTAGVRARYSGLDRGVKLDLTQPYFFSPNFTFGIQGQYWHNDEPGFYDLDNVGGRATITREFRRPTGSLFGGRAPTTLSFTYANEYEEYTIENETLEDLSLRDELISLGLDPRTGTGRGQRSSISLDAGRNTSNNVLDPRRGYMAAIHLEQAGSWLGGDYTYREVTAEGRYYVPFGRRTVVAIRARAGAIDPSEGDLSNVPFYKRYFLGGATNLRGWGRFDVSPLSGSGLPIGGHTFTNFSAEVRVPIWGKLGGVVFFDGGNVWTDPWDFNFNDMRYDVGPGLRYNTPIGPIRADLGFQLNPIDGLLVNGKPEPRQFRFHFSIGQAF
jgi:outer membrane protein insertion porin family/translocation and assembly module TamA